MQGIGKKDSETLLPYPLHYLKMMLDRKSLLRCGDGFLSNSFVGPSIKGEDNIEWQAVGY